MNDFRGITLNLITKHNNHYGRKISNCFGHVGS